MLESLNQGVVYLWAEEAEEGVLLGGRGGVNNEKLPKFPLATSDKI